MELFSGVSPTLVQWVLIPLLIFFARICDVTIGTMRIIFVSKGRKHLAPLLGFFEVLIWLVAIGQVMQNLNNVACYVGWAGGFAMGNYIGLMLEERLALGNLIIRVVTTSSSEALADRLRNEGYGVTTIDGFGAQGRVGIVLTLIKRKDLGHVLEIVNSCNPRAFYTVEDVRSASDVIFSPHTEAGRGLFGGTSPRKAR